MQKFNLNLPKLIHQNEILMKIECAKFLPFWQSYFTEKDTGTLPLPGPSGLLQY